MNGIFETLQDCGLKVELGSTADMTTELMNADENELRNAFDQVLGDAGIGFTAEGVTQKVTMAYALAYALENGLDSIDQEAVDIALEKASELVASIESESESKRTRTPHLREEMLQYIKDNPELCKDQVVSEFSERYPEKATTTLGQYYHGCRRDAGLKPNGKPGRKKGDTHAIVAEIVSKMIQDNPEVKVSDLKEAVLSHPDINLSPSSAQVYVYRARSEIKTN